MSPMRLVHTASAGADFQLPGVMTPVYFEQSGVVAWRSMSGDWFGVPLLEWIPAERKIYETLSFAVILDYASSPGGLARLRRQVIRAIPAGKVRPRKLEQLKGGRA